MELPVEFLFKEGVTPYPIQTEFMRTLFAVFESGGLGVLESPTGTGKSLSIICGSMAWLRSHQRRPPPPTAPAGSAPDVVDGGLSWISDWAASRKREEAHTALVVEPAERTRRLVRCAAGFVDLRPKDRPVVPSSASPQAKRPNISLSAYDNTADHSDDVLSDAGDDARDAETEDVEAMKPVAKIIFCSRTHSQLGQFMRELRDSPYGKDVRAVALGSRQNLCVNPSVHKRPVLQINDACLDLQKARADKGGPGCPFLDRQLTKSFAATLLLSPPIDIEEAHARAEGRCCAYYAAREALPDAEVLFFERVVLVPYSMLLHPSTRASVGLSLKGNVVVIDEAHNLLETIENIHSASITLPALLRAHACLQQYLTRYKTRLSPFNTSRISELVRTVGLLLTFLQREVVANAGKGGDHILSLVDFLAAAELNSDLFELDAFCEKSKIGNKLLGFVQRNLTAGGAAPGPRDNAVAAGEEGRGSFEPSISGHISPLQPVRTFFGALCNRNEDSRIIVHTGTEATDPPHLKFMLLNPAVYFEDILATARAVVVTGGTMGDIDDFCKQLVSPRLPLLLVRQARFSHVVDPANVRVIVVNASAKCRFNFSALSRMDADRVQALGELLVDVASKVPGGLVVFFPSYTYEEHVVGKWESCGMLDRLHRIKPTFREPRRATDMEAVLRRYALEISRNARRGALLFSVVGGKMSEGINFKDDLGRCIVMVGLPYANRDSPDLREKMRYLDRSDPRTPPRAGGDHYLNLCLKAVNQSIGRAIRHQDDHAAILLVDERFVEDRHWGGLPAWLKPPKQSAAQSVLEASAVGDSLVNFFKGFSKAE